MKLNGVAQFPMVMTAGQILFHGREGDFRVGSLVHSLGIPWQVTKVERLKALGQTYSVQASVVPADTVR